MTNNYFATALVSENRVGFTIRAENIGTAFELANDYLEKRYPRSDVMVQAVQCLRSESDTTSDAGAAAGPRLAAVGIEEA